jgi:hypothetical protein
MRLHRLVLPLLLATAACSDPSGPAILRADAIVNARAPQPAPNVTLSVQNQGLRTTFLSRCGEEVIIYLDLRTGGEWKQLPMPLCPALLTAPLELDPGEVASFQYSMTPGHYRARFTARTSLDEDGQITEAATQFIIR